MLEILTASGLYLAFLESSSKDFFVASWQFSTPFLPGYTGRGGWVLGPWWESRWMCKCEPLAPSSSPFREGAFHTGLSLWGRFLVWWLCSAWKAGRWVFHFEGSPVSAMTPDLDVGGSIFSGLFQQVFHSSHCWWLLPIGFWPSCPPGPHLCHQGIDGIACHDHLRFLLWENS